MLGASVLLSLLAPQGTISVGIDATDLFDRYDEEYEDVPGSGFPQIEINKMHISQSIEVRSRHCWGVARARAMEVRSRHYWGVGRAWTMEARNRHCWGVGRAWIRATECRPCPGFVQGCGCQQGGCSRAVC